MTAFSRWTLERSVFVGTGLVSINGARAERSLDWYAGFWQR